MLNNFSVSLNIGYCSGKFIFILCVDDIRSNILALTLLKFMRFRCPSEESCIYTVCLKQHLTEGRA